MRTFTAGLALAVAAASGCGGSGAGGAARRDVSYDFRVAPSGWSGGCADFCVGCEADVACVLDHRALPAPLSGGALHQSGDNSSDDLFMWFAAPVDGLTPGAAYEVTFQLGLVSRYPADDCCGIGASTRLVAGAVPARPTRYADPSTDGRSYWRPSIDLECGYEGRYGAQGPMVILGDITNGQLGDGFAERRVAAPHAVRVRASDAGRVWLVIGTDSCFELSYEVYFTSLAVTLQRVDG